MTFWSTVLEDWINAISSYTFVILLLTPKSFLIPAIKQIKPETKDKLKKDKQ